MAGYAHCKDKLVRNLSTRHTKRHNETGNEGETDFSSAATLSDNVTPGGLPLSAAMPTTGTDSGSNNSAHSSLGPSIIRLDRKGVVTSEIIAASAVTGGTPGDSVGSTAKSAPECSHGNQGDDSSHDGSYEFSSSDGLSSMDTDILNASTPVSIRAAIKAASEAVARVNAKYGKERSDRSVLYSAFRVFSVIDTDITSCCNLLQQTRKVN